MDCEKYILVHLHDNKFVLNIKTNVEETREKIPDFKNRQSHIEVQ